MLGIKATGHTFLQVWKTILQDIQNTKLGDTVMGVACLIILVSMRVSCSDYKIFFPIFIFCLSLSTATSENQNWSEEWWREEHVPKNIQQIFVVHWDCTEFYRCRCFNINFFRSHTKRSCRCSKNNRTRTTRNAWI